MLSYYKHGRKLRPWSETATMPYSDFDLNQLDEIEKVLKKRFNVIRVPGTFDKNINFFNGFAGKNPDNKTFIMTNKAPDLKSLEDYWTSLLVKYGINENNIHFVGDYIPGAGIDCSGAPAGN
jgi:hypothetical protein